MFSILTFTFLLSFFLRRIKGVWALFLFLFTSLSENYAHTLGAINVPILRGICYVILMLVWCYDVVTICCIPFIPRKHSFIMLLKGNVESNVFLFSVELIVKLTLQMEPIFFIEIQKERKVSSRHSRFLCLFNAPFFLNAFYEQVVPLKCFISFRYASHLCNSLIHRFMVKWEPKTHF